MNKYVTIHHGNGGRRMRELIEEIFMPAFGNQYLQQAGDAVRVPWTGELVVTTDGFTVDPLDFPGGNIGKLAACGIINDIAVVGAHPRFCTLTAFIEEGLAIHDLKRYVASFADEARRADMQVVAGDTKVLPKGQVGGLYLSLAAIGERYPNIEVGMEQIRSGDKIAITGNIGEHGAAVLLARNEYGLAGALQSDCASVLPIARILGQQNGIKFMRDPTRGGLATVCHEISVKCNVGIELNEDLIPVSAPVRGISELLGIDPLYLASEGRIVFVASAGEMDRIVANVVDHPGGAGTAVIGNVSEQFDRVVVRTPYGGIRWLPELESEPLPRIC